MITILILNYPTNKMYGPAGRPPGGWINNVFRYLHFQAFLRLLISTDGGIRWICKNVKVYRRSHDGKVLFHSSVSVVSSVPRSETVAEIELLPAPPHQRRWHDPHVRRSCSRMCCRCCCCCSLVLVYKKLENDSPSSGSHFSDSG